LRGCSFVDANGDGVGRVDAVEGDLDADIFNGLNVLTGFLGTPKYVPSEDVGEIVEGRVTLTVAGDTLEDAAD
jgi:hypothetical protein